eukprot:scaffold5033_cov18-Tisochrysis_lutea.AAC.1
MPRVAEARHEAALQRIHVLQSALQAEQQRANLLAAQLAAATAAAAASATTFAQPRQHPALSQQPAPSRRPAAVPHPPAAAAAVNAAGPGSISHNGRGRLSHVDPR